MTLKTTRKMTVKTNDNTITTREELRPPKVSAPSFAAPILFSVIRSGWPNAGAAAFLLLCEGNLWNMTATTNALSTAATGSSQGYAVQKLFSPMQRKSGTPHKQHKAAQIMMNNSRVCRSLHVLLILARRCCRSARAADIPDVSGRTLFVLCDGFSGLAVDDGAEQNLPLQFGQLHAGPRHSSWVSHIHEGVFIRSLWQILRLGQTSVISS